MALKRHKRSNALKINDRIGSMNLFHAFSDASSHLYKSVCPSVRRSVGPSVMLCDALGLFNAFMPFQCHSDTSLACWALLESVSAEGATVFGVFSILLYCLKMVGDNAIH